MHLIDLCEAEKASFGPRDLIQLISLRAEFHDLIGQEVEAEKLLRHHVQSGGSNVVLRIRLEDGESVTEPDYDDVGSAGLIRQICWLHLEFVWVCFYRRGEYAEALEFLDEIARFITSRLAPLKPHSHGTWSRYFFYRAHCLRGMRRFRESEQALARSQEHARLRYLHKIEESRLKESDVAGRELERKEERTFAVICTARILGGGTAWNAIHRGNLMFAHSACLSALTLLEDTGQEPYKLLVEKIAWWQRAARLILMT
jgi:hypothetical protein